jgi:NADH-quinone oxidoreductase subunit L
VTAGLTAFYMWRLMNLTFYGKSRVSPEVEAHIHESPKTMTVPLIVLAAGSVVAGWIGVPKLWTAFGDQFRLFEHWLMPVFASVSHEAGHHEGAHDVGIEWILMGLSVAIAIIGISIARYFYHHRPEIPDRLEAAVRPLHSLLAHKWYVDELYDLVFVNGFGKGLGRIFARFDQHVIDGGVNGAGWLTRFSSKMSIWSDTWIIDGAVRFSSFFVKLLSYPVRIVQTGSVQAYALAVVIGVVAMFGYYVTR